MRKIAFMAAALMLSGLAFAQQSQPRSQQDVEVQQAIAMMNGRFEQAFNRGNASAIGDLYAQDAVILPPGAQMQRGRQAIQTFWQQARQGGLRDLKLETTNVETMGNDAAVEIGRFTASMAARTMAQGGGSSTMPGAPGALGVPEQAGNLATGGETTTRPASGGGAQSRQDIQGKYVVVWKHTGQEWQIGTDIWNTDQ